MPSRAVRASEAPPERSSCQRGLASAGSPGSRWLRRRPRRIAAPPRAARGPRARARAISAVCLGHDQVGRPAATTRPRARRRRRLRSQPASEPVTARRRSATTFARPRWRSSSRSARPRRSAPSQDCTSVSADLGRGDEVVESCQLVAAGSPPARRASACERFGTLQPAPERLELTTRRDAAGAPAARRRARRDDGQPRPGARAGAAGDEPRAGGPAAGAGSARWTRAGARRARGGGGT